MASVNLPLTATFSSPLDPSKIFGKVFVATRTMSAGVNTSLSADGKILSVMPVGNLWDSGTDYTVKILASLA